MFKKAFFLVALVASLASIKAQSLEFLHGKSIKYTMGHAGSTDCYLDFRNLAGDNALFVYRKLQDDFPAKWWVAFCDNKDCFASLIAQDTFAPIADSAVAEFKVTVTPNGFADTSTVSYEIYEAKDPGVKDTVTFQFVVQWGAAVSKLNAGTLRSYPNPAQDRLFLTNIKGAGLAEIFTMDGRLVMSSNIATGGDFVNIAGLPVGYYYVRFSDQSTIQSGSFIKQ